MWSIPCYVHNSVELKICKILNLNLESQVLRSPHLQFNIGIKANRRSHAWSYNFSVCANMAVLNGRGEEKGRKVESGMPTQRTLWWKTYS